MFVHAGIRPGVPLDKQEKQDMLWIGNLPVVEAFARRGYRARAHAQARTGVRLNRIGIDTGAVMGGS